MGKSTLFNALTRSRKAEAANYPFCTIEPNMGVVEVPDERLKPLAEISKTNVIIPAAVEFVDIAGLVAGASKGEGLGNKFLANIREVDAIVHVVRCFDDDDILHSMGSVDPVRDIEIITTELVLSDLQSCEKQLDNNARKAKGMDKEAIKNVELLKRLIAHLNEGKPAITLPDVSEEDAAREKVFTALSDEVNSELDLKWSEMKSYDEGGGSYLFLLLLLAMLALACFNIWRKVRRKTRNQY